MVDQFPDSLDVQTELKRIICLEDIQTQETEEAATRKAEEG